MSRMIRCVCMVVVAGSLSVSAPVAVWGSDGQSGSADSQQTMTPGQRRAAMQAAARQGEAGLPVLQAGLKDDDVLVRRAAVRLLVRMGEPARAVLIQALSNSDAVVRRLAVLSIGQTSEGDMSPVPHLAKAIADQDALVRQAAVQMLVKMEPRNSEVVELLKQARQDDVKMVRDLAADALWPFHKQSLSVRQRPDLDYDFRLMDTIALPKQGWKLQLDPRQDGHFEAWFAADYDDSGWDDVTIEDVWQSFGHDYTGVAWYRGTITLPQEPEVMDGVDISFEGVDESAWIWINGEYVGQHDIGPAGWNVPFSIEVTPYLKWGEDNQITVRVLSVAYAGGIWKPVKLEVLAR